MRVLQLLSAARRGALPTDAAERKRDRGTPTDWVPRGLLNQRRCNTIGGGGHPTRLCCPCLHRKWRPSHLPEDAGTCHWLGRRLDVQSDQSKGGRRARVGSRVYLLRMLCASRAMRSMRRGRQQMASSPVDSPSLARSCDGTPRWCVVRDCLASSRLLPVLSARQCQRGNAAPCQF